MLSLSPTTTGSATAIALTLATLRFFSTSRQSEAGDATGYKGFYYHFLDRDTGRLVSFGSGRHFCMGAPLARLEARIGLTELVDRVASYDVDPDGIERVHSINVRGLAALPTTVTRR